MKQPLFCKPYGYEELRSEICILLFRNDDILKTLDLPKNDCFCHTLILLEFIITLTLSNFVPHLDPKVWSQVTQGNRVF